MTEKYENIILVEEEAETLRNLEKSFGMPLPHIDKIIWEDYKIDENTHQMEKIMQHQFGFIAEDQHVVSLGLSFDSINVKSLKIPGSIPKISKFTKLKVLDVQGWEKVFSRYFKEEKKKQERVQKSMFGRTRMSFEEQKKERFAAASAASWGSTEISPFQLFKQLKDLSELQHLDISGCSIKDIVSFAKLTNLQILDLSENNIKSIPEGFGALNRLHTLNLRNNIIVNYPDVLNKIKSLKNLDLSYNNFKNLPEEFGDLNQMEELTLPAGIADFPQSFVNLTNLRKLVAGNLPGNLKVYKKLETFYLNNGKMEELSDSLEELATLQNLVINNCRTLTKLPEIIGNLKLLKSLEITGNTSLESLPKSIFDLGSLQTLNLYNNNLKKLSDQFGSFPMLEILNLSNNQLETIPYSIYKLNSLIDFTIGNNPLEKNDKIISAKTLPEIKEYSKKKMAINVFVSHAVVDFEPCHIEQLCLYLENQLEIDIAFFCERDLVSNIDSFMDKNVPNSQIVLFIGTPTSINSKDCGYELKLSREYDVEIIPIKSTEIEWPDLAKIGLSRELGIEIDFADTENFEQVCKSIYDYIKQMKRQIDVFDKEKGKMDKLTIGLKMLERNVEKITKEIEDLEERIKIMEGK
jgi:Leucine-rich repeat (LRR) protein